MPSLYIITGSNGAGKSTIGSKFLPAHIRNNYKIFDGDLLFVNKQRKLFPKETRSPKEARKLAFQYVLDSFEELTSKALQNRETFVYEGHFTNHAAWETPKQFKEAGYEINLLFLGLGDPDISESRVAGRVTKGGHYVDRFTIEDNFFGNLEMLNINFEFIDNLTIIDTTGLKYVNLATVNSGLLTYSVGTELLPDWFKRYLPDITKLIP